MRRSTHDTPIARTTIQASAGDGGFFYFLAPKNKMNLPVFVDQKGFHWHAKEPGQCQQIVYRWQTFTVLPFVDGLRVFKPEIGLNIPYGQTCRSAAPLNAAAGGDKVDDRENIAFGHKKRLLLGMKQVGHAQINDRYYFISTNAMCQYILLDTSH